MPGPESDTKLVDRGMINLGIACYRRMVAVCIKPGRQSRDNTAAAVISHHTPHARWLEASRWSARIPEAEADTTWVDRGLILSRDRMLSSPGCCVRGWGRVGRVRSNSRSEARHEVG